MSAQATFVGASRQSIEIEGKRYDLIGFTYRDLHEFSEVIDQFNEQNQNRQDWRASIKRWEKYNDDYQDKVLKGEPVGPPPGPRPPRPAMLASQKAIEGTLKLLWGAIRKSGLTQEQIDRKQWAIGIEALYDKLPIDRAEEVNELLASFFRAKKEGETTEGETKT